MSGSTQGESTSRRLAAAVHAANAANGGVGRAAGGGYQGMAGSFGRAPTGRGLDPAKEAAAAAAGGDYRPPRPASARPATGGGGGGMSFGQVPSPYGFNEPRVRGDSPEVIIARVKEKQRLVGVGQRANTVIPPLPELPKAPTRGQSTTAPRVRPHSATVGKVTGPMARMDPAEYRLQGTGLGAQRSAGDVGGGGGSGGAGGGQFGGANGREAKAGFDANVMGSAPAKEGRSPAVADSGGGAAGAGDVTEGGLANLEDAIRDAVRTKRSVYEGSKEMLLRLFKSVDDGSGDVSPDEFIQVCLQLGINVTPSEAKALFHRFGYDGSMPYQKFATTLLTQPSRQLAEELPTRKGAFRAGQSAAYNGKIIYDHCRKAVLTPTAWDPALAERSAELPEARMVLEYVYGYQGAATSQNCFYTSTGEITYFVAGIGVVYSKPPEHDQRYFLGHNDDIQSNAICRAPIDVKGKQFPGGCLIATGQVTNVHNGPTVSVWDSRAPSGDPDQEVVKLQFDKDARGIVALGFSPDGTRLTCVATDNGHTVTIYDWRRQRVLGSGRGFQGDPPQVYGVEWNPYEVTHKAVSAFLTFGKKHIKVWSTGGSGGDWSAKSLSVGKQPMQNVMSAAWLPPRQGSIECQVVAGMADGQLYIFKGGTAIKGLAAHQPGPNVMQPDGHPAFHGVRGMRLIKNNTVLLTGGADGVVLQWDASDGSIAESRYAAPPLVLASPFGAGERAPRIRSIDYWPEGEGHILVGTGSCDVIELNAGNQNVLVYGHAGDVWFVAFHPVKTEVMATVTDAGRLYLFDTDKRQLIRSANVGFKLRAVGISTGPLMPDGAHHIAVGGDKGDMQILSESNLQPLHKTDIAKDSIADLKYSPNNKYLAAATYDQVVEVFSVEKGYARVCRCSGHSSVVAGIDWTTDSSVLQSHSNDKDLLYWNAKTGKQVPIPPRDLEFATWTSKSGFPVMGIWPAEGAAHDDINAVARSSSGQFLVSAEDSGLVKLFNYPCVIDDAPYRAYRGHSSHVMCARFNRDDTKVVSVGGHDWAVFQFQFVLLEALPPPPPPPEPTWGATDASGRNFGWTNGAQQPPPASTSSRGRGTPPPALRTSQLSAANSQQDLDLSHSNLTPASGPARSGGAAGATPRGPSPSATPWAPSRGASPEPARGSATAAAPGGIADSRAASLAGSRPASRAGRPSSALDDQPLSVRAAAANSSQAGAQLRASEISARDGGPSASTSRPASRADRPPSAQSRDPAASAYGGSVAGSVTGGAPRLSYERSTSGRSGRGPAGAAVAQSVQSVAQSRASRGGDVGQSQATDAFGMSASLAGSVAGSRQASGAVGRGSIQQRSAAHEGADDDGDDGGIFDDDQEVDFGNESGDI